MPDPAESRLSPEEPDPRMKRGDENSTVTPSRRERRLPPPPADASQASLRSEQLDNHPPHAAGQADPHIRWPVHLLRLDSAINTQEPPPILVASQRREPDLTKPGQIGQPPAVAPSAEEPTAAPPEHQRHTHQAGNVGCHPTAPDLLGGGTKPSSSSLPPHEGAPQPPPRRRAPPRDPPECAGIRIAQPRSPSLPHHRHAEKRPAAAVCRAGLARRRPPAAVREEEARGGAGSARAAS